MHLNRFMNQFLSFIGYSTKETILRALRDSKRNSILSNEELDYIWNELNGRSKQNEDGDMVSS